MDQEDLISMYPLTMDVFPIKYLLSSSFCPRRSFVGSLWLRFGLLKRQPEDHQAHYTQKERQQHEDPDGRLAYVLQLEVARGAPVIEQRDHEVGAPPQY